MHASTCHTASRLLPIVALATITGPVRAAMLPALSGHHRAGAEANQLADASLSFAVFDRSGGDADPFETGIDDFANRFSAGEGSPSALDASAPYLYLFQYVNDGPGGAVDIHALGIDAIQVTSWGHWSLGFTDNDGPIVAGNPLGTIVGDYLLAAPAKLGANGGRVADTQNANDQHPYNLRYTQGLLRVDFPRNLDPLRQHERTGLFGFTSHAAPEVRNFTLAECNDDRVCGGFVGPPGPPSGDYNFDGRVDAADYSVFRDQRGRIDIELAADGDRNGRVDSLDYDLWRDNYGADVYSPAFVFVVPEPASALIAVIAATCVAQRGRAA